MQENIERGKFEILIFCYNLFADDFIQSFSCELDFDHFKCRLHNMNIVTVETVNLMSKNKKKKQENSYLFIFQSPMKILRKN